ncbi:MAG TPA: hypothetical protein P5290_03170, partial [Candidatus Methanomethylicus sp.]|nr:hypothetical protein [Candidatus Methanomethylicus sp.]
KYNSEDWFGLVMMNNYGDEREDLKTIALTEQEGALQTGTRFYSMTDYDGLDELVVQLPGESVFALAANAWMKYDYVMKMREKEQHGTDGKK